MIRRIILGLLLAGLIAIIYVGFRNWSASRAMLAGDVTVVSSDPLPVSTPPPPPPAQIQTPAQAEPQKPSQPTSSPALAPDPSPATKRPPVVPLADSQPPEAPNGLRLAGDGRFEVYRQGNITYRFDTSTGKSCVLYATKEEWRKPEVYRHGCGSSAAQ
jgi:hypothetical protein